MDVKTNHSILNIHMKIYIKFQVALICSFLENVTNNFTRLMCGPVYSLPLFKPILEMTYLQLDVKLPTIIQSIFFVPF